MDGDEIKMFLVTLYIGVLGCFESTPLLTFVVRRD